MLIFSVEMGTVYKDRKGKSWYIDYRYKGKRTRKAISESKDMAEKVLHDIQLKIEREEFLGIHANQKITFETFSQKYLEYSRANKRQSSYERDELSIKWLNETFGDFYLYDITPERIEEYKNMRLASRAPGTVNREIACLKNMFTIAIHWKYVKENPVKKVSLLKEPPGRVRYLTKDELNRLLSVSSDKLKRFILFAVNTGMRKGEILNLEWRDVDWENRSMIVQDSKSNEKRIVPMNETVYNTLSDMPHNGDKVFGSDQRKAFETAVRKADIEDFRIHDLRHTFASYLAMRGCNLQTIKELLGHKEIKMTLRYAHLCQANLKAAVTLLDRI